MRRSKILQKDQIVRNEQSNETSGNRLAGEQVNTDTRPTQPSTDQLDTIPSFAAEIHAPQLWRQVCGHLDDGDLSVLAELLAVGIIRNEQIAESTGWSLETVAVNRAELDEQVIALGAKLSFD